MRTATMPVGFHPWRLVRLPGSVAIISEDGRSRIEVARDQTAWPREFALSEHHAGDAAYRVAPLVRTSAGISLQPFRGAGALPIRAIGPYYVASARELERFALDDADGLVETLAHHTFKRKRLDGWHALEAFRRAAKGATKRPRYEYRPAPQAQTR